MTLKNKLTQCLQELRHVDYSDAAKARASNGKAENALNFIYQARLKQVSFTEEEKSSIGALLASAIKPIQVNVVSTATVPRTRLDSSVLMKRSAIQFLIDDYASFPAGNTTLGTELEKAVITECVEILDDVIEKWCDISDSDEGSSDREAAGASAVPAAHTWWSK